MVGGLLSLMAAGLDVDARQTLTTPRHIDDGAKMLTQQRGLDAGITGRQCTDVAGVDRRMADEGLDV